MSHEIHDTFFFIHRTTDRYPRGIAALRIYDESVQLPDSPADPVIAKRTLLLAHAFALAFQVREHITFPPNDPSDESGCMHGIYAARFRSPLAFSPTLTVCTDIPAGSKVSTYGFIHIPIVTPEQHHYGAFGYLPEEPVFLPLPRIEE